MKPLLAFLFQLAGLSFQLAPDLIVRGPDGLGNRLIDDMDRDITWYSQQAMPQTQNTP